MFSPAGMNLGFIELEGSTYLLQVSSQAGVGVIARAGAYGAPPTIPIASAGYTVLGSAGSNSNYGEANVEIRLIATGDNIDASNTSAVSPGRTFVRDCRGDTDCYGILNASQDVLWSSTPINFVEKTCSVTSKDIMFALPPMRSGDFPAVGSTAGSITKNLQLNCSSGPDVHMVISDQTTPSNRSSTLTLTPDSAAKGFGIEVLHNSSPIRFGPDSAMAGAENQFSVGNNLSGAISIPLTARYVRTSANITAGSVKGLATFTMSYQ
jgi:type 1 fimbria pilin